MTATTSGYDDYGQAAGETNAATASDLKATVQQQSRGLVRDAKSEVRRMADERKQEAASLLGDVAGVIDQATSALAEKGHDRVARYAGAAASRLKQMSDDLPGRDLDSLLGQMGSFARERPALFVGGMFLAGFGAARFLGTSRRGAGDFQTASAGSEPYAS
jgi:hypothetical protein